MRPSPPSRYGEGRGPNYGALIGALAIVGGLLASLATLNVVGAHKENARMTVFDVLSTEPPPPPPPAKQQPKPVEQVETASPVVAPVPPIQVSVQPAPIVTAPTPSPVEVSIPGPPAPAQPAAPAGPSIESVGDLSSKMISAKPPRYPQESRRKREQGTVVLMVLLDVDGSVADISVSRSSGFDRLDRAALDAVRRWRWSPTQRGGRPVMVKGLVEIPFVLQEARE